MKSELSIYHIVGFFAVFILLVFIFLVPSSEIFNPPHPGMTVTKMNVSGIPDGPVVQAVDEDFDEYPSLARVMRDKSKQGDPNEDGTRIGYSVGLSWEEYNKIIGSKFFKNPETYFFEYRGNYFKFGLC
ncbi:hypothetical protein [Methanoregula sp. PtaB.Bin085]|uniref:hypothetical protein n=1 Tax=Methanoregula sp. PtaB.Bin085 TaxID=1811680 RepID=UPI0009C4D00B|nr:hypothetical protein [Methanoregula sp. PtaB.Bin085]OPX63785.1 MAG: hypothetical protein A4E33_01485 [Methanoregula sp. PtaB.Bin085]